MKNVIYLLIFVLIGCNQSKVATEGKEHPYFTNSVIKILEAQDKRDGKLVASYLNSKNEILREKAAMAFASIQDKKYAETLLSVIANDSSLTVRNACIYSLGQLRDSNLSQALIKVYKDAPGALHFALLNSIGKCGAESALVFFDEIGKDKKTNDFALSQGLMRYSYSKRNYNLFRPYIWNFLGSECLETRRNGASMLQRVFKDRNSLQGQEILSMEDLLLKEEDPNTLKILLAFMNKEKTSQEKIDFNPETAAKWEVLKDPYKKATFISKLTIKSYNGLDFLLAIALNEESKAVKTAAANALIKSLSNPKLIINKNPKSSYIMALLNAKDMALESVATYGIKDTNVISKEEAKIVFLEKLISLKSTYENPRQKETYLDVSNTIAYLEDQPRPEIEMNYNHPIDWEYVKNISASQKVKISTTQGDIIIECKVHEAPGSVSNFLKLVDSGYYNNKAFHRVVPNFVIQTGCSRGDGWGAPKWTQRSEVSNYLSYNTGAVGLASSGKDTESVQWFITHTYTPFLDGRYSIFAFVTAGMNIVDKMEVGDMVLKVERI